MRDPHVTQILVLSFFLILFVGGIFGLAVGAGLIYRADAMLRFFGRMNRWISTRRVLRPLELPRSGSIKGSRHWIAGALLAAGGAYAAFMLSTRIDVLKVAGVLGVYGAWSPIAFILVDSIRWFLIVGCLAGMVTGVMLVAFPRAWSRVEMQANRWCSTRQLASGGDTMHMSLDGLVERHPRAAGVATLVASLIPVIASGILLFGR